MYSQFTFGFLQYVWWVYFQVEYQSNSN